MRLHILPQSEADRVFDEEVIVADMLDFLLEFYEGTAGKRKVTGLGLHQALNKLS